MTFFMSAVVRVYLALICLALAGYGTALSQSGGKTPDVVQPSAPLEVTAEKRVMSVGVLAMYNMSIHSATALKLPGIPSCCPGYEGATGGGIAAGVDVSIPMSDKLEFIARGLYQSSTGTMTFNEPVTVRKDNKPVETFFTHELKSTLTFFMLEPGIEYAVIDNLRVVGGIRLGALAGSTYTQKETLDPSIQYDFSDGSGVRNDTQGDITGTSAFQMGIFAGVRYHLPLNKKRTFEIVPEVQFAPLFTSVMADASWSVSSLRFGIGFQYNLTKSARVANPLKP